MSDPRAEAGHAAFFVRPASRAAADATAENIADALLMLIDRDRASRGLAPLPETKAEDAAPVGDRK